MSHGVCIAMSRASRGYGSCGFGDRWDGMGGIYQSVVEGNRSIGLLEWTHVDRTREMSVTTIQHIITTYYYYVSIKRRGKRKNKTYQKSTHSISIRHDRLINITSPTSQTSPQVRHSSPSADEYPGLSSRRWRLVVLAMYGGLGDVGSYFAWWGGWWGDAGHFGLLRLVFVSGLAGCF